MFNHEVRVLNLILMCLVAMLLSKDAVATGANPGVNWVAIAFTPIYVLYCLGAPAVFMACLRKLPIPFTKFLD